MQLPLSQSLPGTWQLVSRIDVNDVGSQVEEPSLGSDPIAVLIYDRAGNFAAQFMKRDRTVAGQLEATVAGMNNTRAQGGYDAYFGRYSVDDATAMVTQTLVGSLSPEGVGCTITRGMVVSGDRLEITLKTTSITGATVTRSLLWKRVG